MLSVDSHFQQDLRQGLFGMDSHITAPYSNPGMDFNDQSSFQTHLPYFDSSTFLLEPPQDPSQHSFYQSVPLNTASKASAPQSTEQPPSTFSSASGPSVPSASSSTIGSPYSNPAQTVSYSEPWMATTHGQTHGLGLDPAIATGEDFGTDFSVSEIDQEMDVHPHGKLAADFVGESTSFPSTSKPQSSNFSNAHLSPPSLAIRTALDDPAMTIDSILENAKNNVTSPAHFPTPVSGQPLNISPTQMPDNLSSHHHKEREIFKTPTTPASVAARTPVRLSPPCIDRSHSRGSTRSATMPLRTRSQPPSSPNAGFQTSVSPIHHPFGTSFFPQSSFVLPLSSSCWFPYCPFLSVSSFWS